MQLKYKLSLVYFNGPIIIIYIKEGTLVKKVKETYGGMRMR